MDTLVLTNSYIPLGRISWEDAISLVVTERVVVLENYEDRFIHSARAKWPMPCVVKFISSASGLFRRGARFNRKNIWLRDKGQCQYCGKKVAINKFTFEHVVPRSKGGITKWENIVVACEPCNTRKGGRTPEEAKMRLKANPVRPKSLPGLNFPALTWGEGMPETWKDYLGSYKYWNLKLEE